MICSRCDNEARPNNRYCVDCHNAYMRTWRKAHPVTGAAAKRQRATSWANLEKNRLGIQPLPCELCASTDNIEMHHEDYDYPLWVIWLCHGCHRPVTRKILSVSHLEPHWLLSNEVISCYSAALEVPASDAARKVGRFLVNKRKEWLANGSPGFFKSYPVPYEALREL